MKLLASIPGAAGQQQQQTRAPGVGVAFSRAVPGLRVVLAAPGLL